MHDLAAVLQLEPARPDHAVPEGDGHGLGGDDCPGLEVDRGGAQLDPFTGPGGQAHLIAQLELHQKGGRYEKVVYNLPKHLDEEVARLHLDQLGVRLTELTPKQAEYIGVPVEGPFKRDTYRY